MRVCITGGTGLIGRRLTQALLDRGDQAIVISRRPEAAKAALGPNVEVVSGDPSRPASWMEAIPGCDGVVNLAGEGIFNQRWNDDFKRLMTQSRVETTMNVVEAITKANPRPKVLVNGSAIGYYGFTGDEELTEDSPAGSGDFLSQLTPAWEAAAQPVTNVGTRLVLLRTGVVLDKNGGALREMLKPYRMSLTLVAGGAIGSGRQWVSWIHHADEVGLILHALDRPEVSGPLNATAPHPVTNAQMAQAIGRAVGRLAFPPTPGFALHMMLGEVAQVVTRGQRVLPKKALATGYQFRFPTIDVALADILSHRAAAA
jgi:uncharacterized protein (TIGR01777 family)